MNFLKFSYIRTIIYFLTFLHLGSIRTELNQNHLFITSDGQIKYYQTLQIASGEFAKSECLYPGKNLDPEYKLYIFDYPWAFFGVNGLQCAFQYSPYFPWIASLVHNLIGEEFTTYTTLIFWFLALLLFDRVLTILQVRGWIILLISLSLFWCGFLSLSALDYGELSMNDCLAMLGVLGMVQFLVLRVFNFDTTPSNLMQKEIIYLFVGIIGLSSSILLRPEGIIGIGLFILCILIGFRRILMPILTRVSFLISIILPGLLTLAIFFIVNENYSGNMLGFRASNTGKDMNELYKFSNLLSGFVADIWKSEYKYGLFFAMPSIFLFTPILVIFQNKLNPLLDGKYNFILTMGYSFLIAGILSCFLIPIISPYRAGYHHFGNRYFELAVIFVFLGIGILWTHVLDQLKLIDRNQTFFLNPIVHRILLLLIFATSSYYSFRYTKEGWKVLKDSSKLYSIMQDNLDRIGRSEYSELKIPIVHKSLFTNYLVGVSFLDRSQYFVNNKDKMSQLENIFQDSGIESYMTIEYLGQPKYMSDIPKNLYDEKINIRFESPKDSYREELVEDFLEFRLSLRVRNK